jgi:hypothetical protein
MAAMVGIGDVVLRAQTGDITSLARVVALLDGAVRFEDIAIFKSRALAEAAARELCEQGRVVWSEGTGSAFVRFTG